MTTNGQISGRMAGFGLWLALVLTFINPPDFLDLQNAPVLLLLVSTMYSLFLPLGWSLLMSAAAVLVLNYELVPPIKTLSVDLRAHGILLIAITLVSWLLAYLMRQQKEIALKERAQAARSLELMNWSEVLREVEDPHTLLPQLHRLLKSCSRTEHQSELQSENCVLGFSEVSYPLGAALTPVQLEGFTSCLNQNTPIGPGTGRYESQTDLYLPFRGKSRAFGVGMLLRCDAKSDIPSWLSHAQAICDQMGSACERRHNALRAEKSKELARMQETRSLFLSAIAHDQRTPLASVITTATAILDQAHILSPSQVMQYAGLIVSESSQMARLIENTLSLARLTGQGVSLAIELESVEDIVSSVFQRLRMRNSPHIPQVRVEPGMRLFACNMTLLEQALDNLIDNAIKHSGVPNSVEVHIFREQGHLVFEVSNHGKGMDETTRSMADGGRGMGIGLKLCDAVAVAHGGQLKVEQKPGGGVVAQLMFPDQKTLNQGL